MRSWMKSTRMPITTIEQKCLQASEHCVRNAWATKMPTTPYAFAWSDTPYLRNMQVGKIGIQIPAHMITQIYIHSNIGKWICK